jgi:hypothetical protein
MGFRAACIMGHHDDATRDEVIRHFNHGEGKVDILISTTALLGTGQNLHQSCYVGILMMPTGNEQTREQAMSRNRRLMQDAEKVTWHIIASKDGLYSISERHSLVKMLPILRMQVQLPLYLNSTLRDVILFEMLRAQLSLNFNRAA